MLTALALVALIVGFLVAFSRSGVPHDQRVPWDEMDLGNLVREAVDGARRLAELNSRR